MNRYSVRLYNTDTDTTRTITMHGSNRSEIWRRARLTVGPCDVVIRVWEWF